MMIEQFTKPHYYSMWLSEYQLDKDFLVKSKRSHQINQKSYILMYFAFMIQKNITYQRNIML